MLAVAAFLILRQDNFPSGPIWLDIDASDAPRNMIRVRETLPVKPGPFLIRYPEWRPGNHGPTGPLANIVDFHLFANGKELTWRRDPVEMYDIHVNIPQNAETLEVRFINAMQPGREMTSRLGRVKTIELIFLPKGNVETMSVKAKMKVPAGWTAFDALPMTQNGDMVDFPLASAERFIDSPALIGLNAKSYEIAPGHFADVVADEAAGVQMNDATMQGWKNLVAEAHALWGAQHYRQYHWLLSLSNFGAFDGLEHNECSEDGTGANAFQSEGVNEGLADLISHEYTHSWNGKYRRPSDLYQTDYATPQGGSLLWVYEGMTQYWGNVLPTRAGMWNMENLKSAFARNAASLANKEGRTWRSTEDTSVAASILRNAGTAWGNARRAQDYYFEGTLVWVGADAIIRKQSNGAKSLDDFCKLFFGGKDSGPEIKPYTYQDLVGALNSIAPYDWNGYFQKMVYDVHPGPTTEGLEMAGWRLVYTNEAPPAQTSGRPGRGGGANHTYDIGVSLDGTGLISDMVIGSSADKAGLAPSMKIIMVGDKQYSSDVLNAAITDAMKSGEPTSVQVSKEGVTSNLKIDYRGGLRYPHLERIEGTKDYLTEIAKPKVGQ